MLVFAPAAPINFTNAEHIAETIQRRIAEARTPVHLLVIEASGVIDVDYTGSQILQGMIADLRERGIEVALTRLADTRAQEDARRSGLIAAVGASKIFLSVEEAVRALAHRAPSGTTSPG